MASERVKKEENLNVFLYNRDPNKTAYKGRKGWKLTVEYTERNKSIERFEWRTRKFKVNDPLNGVFEKMRMDQAILDGGQFLGDETVGHWVLVEKDGVGINIQSGFVSLFN